MIVAYLPALRRAPQRRCIAVIENRTFGFERSRSTAKNKSYGKRRSFVGEASSLQANGLLADRNIVGIDALTPRAFLAREGEDT